MNLKETFYLALAISILPNHGSVLTILHLSLLATEAVVKGWQSEGDFSAGCSFVFMPV